LGDQIAALATLRGKLYELDEAARLGFFHEVVEPDKLLATAISYARCITPDCNTAYAMSKKALQDGVLRQIAATSCAEPRSGSATCDGKVPSVSVLTSYRGGTTLACLAGVCTGRQVFTSPSTRSDPKAT
jgi:hypothetical protein